MEPTFQFTFLNEFPSRDTEVTSSLLLFQTCFPIIAHYVLLVADVMIGVVFTLGVLAVRIMNTNIYIFSNKHKPGKRPDLHPDVCLMEEYSHRGKDDATVDEISSVWPVSVCWTWTRPCCVPLQLLGLVLSSIMIHQMRYPDRPPVLLSVPAIFSTPPPKYQELHNPPQY